LNLPYSRPIYRCYRCSINSPAFCLPPLELLYLAAVLREAGVETSFLDAVAERVGQADTLKRIHEIQPDLIVSIMGYEHFTEDVATVNFIRENASVPHYTVMGYLPSHYPAETLRHLQADSILRFEPEQTLREVVNALRSGRGLDGIAGAVWRDGETFRVGPDRPRMSSEELEGLPLPARDLLKLGIYREPFLSKPFTTYQAGRGCPYKCTYCTATYGSKFVTRSPAHVVAEIEENRRRLGIRHFRFTDDTFAVSLPWTREFAERMMAANGSYDWVCLTRVDLMDPERMRLLRAAGCRRLHVGIESGSQRILDYYNKRIRADQIPEMVRNAQREGLEVVGYFVVGSPIETEADYQQTVDLAERLKLDMASVYPMMPYPDTASCATLGEAVEFQLYPYQVQYRDAQITQVANQRARSLMKRIYLSPHFMASKVKWVARYPVYSLTAGREFGRWLLHRPSHKRKTLL
ncbi:MAG: B12-binding domain-containing radical SAM protein, partial [Phycisphaerae bacterium]|nr:B12-binding domain-containing radical SAM protein [Phycisphaerae bacterium]